MDNAPQVGPTARIQEKLVRAAQAVAAGKAFDDAAKLADLTPRAFRHLRNEYRPLWNLLCARAVQAVTNAICIMDGVELDGRDMLVNFFQNVYIPSRLEMSESSANLYGTVLRAFHRFLGRPAVLKDLNDEVVCRFLAWRLSSGCRPSTVNSNRAHLLSLWNLAWRKRLLDEQPRDVPRLREPQRMPKAWNVEEVKELVQTCRKWPGQVEGIPAAPYWTSLTLTVWDTSCRIGALQRVQPVDCDLTARELLIRGIGTRKEYCDQFFPLAKRTVRAIEPIYTPERERLWPWRGCRKRFFAAYRTIVEAAGLSIEGDHSLFHKLRRTSLSYCARESLELARQQAGHSDSRMTLRCYIDPTIARRRSAIDVLPDLDKPERGNGRGGPGES